MTFVPSRLPSCGARPNQDRIGINVNRHELELIVESVRTAMAFHFDQSVQHEQAHDDLSSAYARKRHDDCAAMLHWLQTVHDTAQEKTYESVH